MAIQDVEGELPLSITMTNAELSPERLDITEIGSNFDVYLDQMFPSENQHDHTSKAHHYLWAASLAARHADYVLNERVDTETLLHEPLQAVSIYIAERTARAGMMRADGVEGYPTPFFRVFDTLHATFDDADPRHTALILEEHARMKLNLLEDPQNFYPSILGRKQFQAVEKRWMRVGDRMFMESTWPYFMRYQKAYEQIDIPENVVLPAIVVPYLSPSHWLTKRHQARQLPEREEVNEKISYYYWVIEQYRRRQANVLGSSAVRASDEIIDLI